jgi:hypothetical protein
VHLDLVVDTSHLNHDNAWQGHIMHD